MTATWTVFLCGAGCATSPPNYTKSELTTTYPGSRERPVVVVTDQQWIGELVDAMPPGVGMGKFSSMGVGAIQSHQIVLTREHGKTDVVTIYNGGVAWSEGRGDWLLDDTECDRLARLLASKPTSTSPVDK